MCCFSIGWTQDNRQEKLRQQRKQLQQEIKQINNLLFSNTKKKKSALNEVEDLAVIPEAVGSIPGCGKISFRRFFRLSPLLRVLHERK